MEKKRLIFKYVILSLLIIWPLLKSGFVFATDMSWSLEFNFPQKVDNYFLLNFVLYLLNMVFSSAFIQKAMLFLVFFLAGFSAYRLTYYLTESRWSSLFASFLYLFSPFLYSRIVFGQIWHCLAYALLPFLFYGLLKFINSLQWKDLIFTLIFWFLISQLSLHLFYISVFTVLILLVGSAFKKKNQPRLKKYLLKSLILILAVVIVNLYWLIPFTFGDSEKNQRIQGFDWQHNLAFSTDPGNTHVLLNALGMHGFWAEKTGFYLPVNEFNPFWWVIFGLIFLFVVWGVIVGWKNKKHKPSSVGFLVIGILALILGVGSAFAPFEALVKLLNKYVPFYQGLREPQKWLAFLAIVYLYFGSIGVKQAENYFKKINKTWLVGLIVVLPLVYNPLMFNGFRGQLSTANYPAEWYEVKKIIDQDEDDFNVLALPWHGYMSFDFLEDRVTANPFCRFLEKDNYCGDNMEVGGIYSSSTRPFSLFWERDILGKTDQIRDLGEKLSKWDIKYIILLKEVDWSKYAFVQNQKNLKNIFDNQVLQIWKNNAY